MIDCLLAQCVEMNVVEPVRERDGVLVPTMVSGLVSANQQDRMPQWIKCVEHPVRSSGMLDPKLSHVRMPGTENSRTVWVSESGSVFLQQADVGSHGRLLSIIEPIPPVFEFIGKFYLALHALFP
tara:strand:- start:2263 stop:2637 length:375 start_codon:yes stop_codon:yes gene_type:complete